MISRRLIRVKSFQVLFSQILKNENDFNHSYKELTKSISKTQDLYFLILRLIVDVRDLGLEKTETKKRKLLATKEDLDPKMAFFNNSLIAKIEENKQYKRFQELSLNWNEFPSLVENIYKKFIASDNYQSYILNEKNTFANDKKIINFLLENIIAENEDIVETLEEMSIYWTEDFEFVLNSISKTIRTIKLSDEDDNLYFTIYKDEDDKIFAYNLLKFVLQNHDDYLDLIEKHTKNWEIERIIQADIVLMEMAIAEFINMPSIPIKVSLNEYIELSKYYSSAKSKIFINGVLDKVIKELVAEEKIVKKGRGLIGQV